MISVIRQKFSIVRKGPSIISILLLAIGMVYVGVTNPIFVILFTFNIAATVFAISAIVLTKKARKEIIEGQEQEKEG